MTTTQRIASFDGTQIAVSESGIAGAPAILFSHHLGGSSAGWDAQARALSKKFRIVCFDSRGQGASGVPAGPYDIAMLGRDALAVIHALDLGRVHFVGLSQGGMAAMWLAQHHAEMIDRLVLANTAPFIPNKPVWDQLIARAAAEGMREIAAQTILSWLSEGFRARDPETTAALVETMAAMSPAGYAANCAVLRDVDLRDGLARISAPTLVIGGSEDGPRGAAAAIMASAIPKARLTMISQAAHLSPIENPDAFNAALMEHFA